MSKKKDLHNRKALADNRKNLRNNLTTAEAYLWSYLKNSQLEGRKFRRQHSIGAYILDFYCPSDKLAVELDGAGHFTHIGYELDVERDAYLKELEITVLRFENKFVFEHTDYVLEQIKAAFN